MGRRHLDSGENITNQLAPLMEDDEFLTALSRGEDPSGGEDELAGLFLELRNDIETNLPPGPVIEGEEEAPVVLPMSARRRRMRPLLHGLLGAAAATVAIVSGGAVLTNAGVIGGSESSNATAVELASTLDELDRSTAEGDVDGTRELLADARRLLGELDSEDSNDTSVVAERVTSTRETTAVVTETATETEIAPAPAPETETEAAEPAPAETVTVTSTAEAPEQATVTHYATVTETVVRDNPIPPGQGEPAPGEGNGGNEGNGEGNEGVTPPQQQQ